MGSFRKRPSQSVVFGCMRIGIARAAASGVGLEAPGSTARGGKPRCVNVFAWCIEKNITCSSSIGTHARVQICRPMTPLGIMT